ncbi:MAG: efflux RND transporter periplasmic adaptor subunit [Chlamydiales bacterium]
MAVSSSKFPYWRQLIWSLILILITFTLIVLLYLTRPEISKETPEATYPIVSVIPAIPTTEQISIQAFGTVEPNSEVTIRAQVSGEVIQDSRNLTEGGKVSEGELLLRIDPRDYQNAVEQERAAYEKALFDLKVEEGRQIVAKREWEQLSESIQKSEISEELVLRKPHLKEKQAAIEAAESRLNKALLDLERTYIYSPITGIVVEANAETGDYVTPQSVIAKIVETDKFRIKVSVPLERLQWIDLPIEEEGVMPKVTVTQELGANRQHRYQGSLLRLLGSLDEVSRMARIIAVVKDPLDQPHPLLLGTYVRVDIPGPKLRNVFVVPRKALRDGKKVWVLNQNDELEIRDVVIAMNAKDYVIVQEGIQPEDRIITSHLSVPIPGMKLRLNKNYE